MRAWFANFALLVVAACGTPTIDAPDSYIPNDEIQSGYAFLTPETQALQDDPFENPGLLWVDRGETLFSSADTDATSCASCHSNGLQGVAATYPKVDARTDEVLNLEARINSCRTEHQKLDPLGYESDALLALTTYVASESRGEPISVD
ncbi:MAG: sulfur oxidation c-type cytochrome SoxA, partial [Pseudomonadota bacterium]